MKASPFFAASGLAVAALLAFACGRAPADVARPAARTGFDLTVVAHIDGARELTLSPQDELLVGTLGNDVYAVADAEGAAKAPRVFTSIDDAPAAGVALTGSALYIGTQHGVWRVPYRAGDRSATRAPTRLAAVRSASSGGAHRTTTVARAGDNLYASVGSSCNACEETDPTRATILEMSLGGGGVRPRAIHIRNAIALAPDATTGDVWAGVAGQDELEHGHPYETFAAFTRHAGTADYGWPYCYENRKATQPGHDCSHTAVADAVFPAYETPVGAVIYPLHAAGPYAFPAAYRGGAFVALHGSWHKPLVQPRVVFVPLHDGAPAKPVDWNDPSTQWSTFVDRFQEPDGARIGRPTGVAVGPQGSLFVADDEAGVVYRIRPTAGRAGR